MLTLRLINALIQVKGKLSASHSELPAVSVKGNGEGIEEEKRATEDCEFYTEGKCMLFELIQRQEDLENSHKVLCKLVKMMYDKVCSFEKKLNKFLGEDD